MVSIILFQQNQHPQSGQVGFKEPVEKVLVTDNTNNENSGEPLERCQGQHFSWCKLFLGHIMRQNNDNLLSPGNKSYTHTEIDMTEKAAWNMNIYHLPLAVQPK